ncbi:hypothetical protein TBR22_A46410 [Luteitalea sp. TBR-22]|uniref:DUF6933 domain-containing protein n=1 Tax=Luteitalea sp. TBR-22 TaxID=2802971 RepID=UPI001AF9AF30|nr:hypothetical protein [Luteitalea sp. TBR-22]BCS35414.1 hypothetical protein TBR22_A46410 [Luteitalea sp. TBR-22]
MYTLRFPRALLREVAEPSEVATIGEAPTTRLGDWYVAPLAAAGRELLLCTSDRSLLSVVLPAEDLEDLPERLAVAVVGVLHRLDVPRPAVAREIDAMTSGEVGPARDRAVMAAMRALARRTRAWLEAEDGPVDVAELYTHLGEYRPRGRDVASAASTAVALLTARPAARARGTATAPKAGATSPRTAKSARKKR